MKHKLYKNYIFMIIALLFMYMFFHYTYKESFVPKIIKESYRPFERNIRKKYQGFYNNTSSTISNLFRKYGIA